MRWVIARHGNICGSGPVTVSYTHLDVYKRQELQEAVSQLAHQEIQMIKDIITSGQNSGEFKTVLLPDELAVIVCSTLKGALMLNRLPPHDIYSGTVNALIKMLDTRT